MLAKIRRLFQRRTHADGGYTKVDRGLHRIGVVHQAEHYFPVRGGIALYRAGALPQGTAHVVNRSGRIEPILTTEQWNELISKQEARDDD